MAERGAAHRALRAGTRAEHERLDGLFEGFDLASRVGYRGFLAAHALALPAVERALDDAGFAARLPDWPARRRTAALAADLASLGAPLPDPIALSPLPDAAAAWGAAYVIEGSRLGGAFLARQVADGLPRAYLGTQQPPGAWRGFLAALDAALTTDEDISSACETARIVFALFEDAGLRMMERT